MKEFDCLQPCKTNIYAAFLYKVKQREAKVSLVFFFGINKTLVCLTSDLTKFPFKQTFIFSFIHFHFSSITFERKCVLFHVIERQFYEGHFRNSVNKSIFLGSLTEFGNLCLIV